MGFLERAKQALAFGSRDELAKLTNRVVVFGARSAGSPELVGVLRQCFKKVGIQNVEVYCQPDIGLVVPELLGWGLGSEKRPQGKASGAVLLFNVRQYCGDTGAGMTLYVKEGDEIDKHVTALCQRHEIPLVKILRESNTPSLESDADKLTQLLHLPRR